ncbi:hypothetical protein [Ketobacter alkanivorans]|uniref:Uncharacterized protein n=1 Tax=Ketobacter alkanivorans TaxID=1917421 RepID=A0A2K9LKM1_9GAMM|nr:hypothetical protein [Ketobacter alkanivorans]AUM12909.1 hypothetical protein Kalk_10955 [Ketobacter alkanivorans]
MKYSRKFLATYVQGKYGYSAFNYLKKDPAIKVIHMVNTTAGAAIREIEAQRAALGIIHFLETLEIPHEPEYDQGALITKLTQLIKTGTKKVSELSKEVDKHYLFADEPA